MVGTLGACSDALDGPYDDLVAYPVGLGIRPARMICVASEVLSARSVDRPTAVDLVEIAVAPGLKHIGLLGRELAALVFDDERSLLDRRRRKEAQAGAGTAAIVGKLLRVVKRFVISAARFRDVTPSAAASRIRAPLVSVSLSPPKRSNVVPSTSTG